MTIVLFDDDLLITGIQTFPDTTHARHIRSDTPADDLIQLVRRVHLVPDGSGGYALPDLATESLRLAAEDLQIKIVEKQKEIDNEAARVVSAALPYAGAMEEYQYTANQVQAWVDAGSDESNVPPVLQADMEAFSRSAADGAAEILAISSSLFLALEATRHARLTGKAAVRAATTEEEAEAAAASAVAALQAIAAQFD